MSKTNEIIHNNIELTINHINELIRTLHLSKYDQIKEYIDCFKNIQVEYQPINLQYLNELTENLVSSSSKSTNSQYYYMILSNNIISRLEIYSSKITDFVEQLTIHKNQTTLVTTLLNKIKRIDLNIKIKRNNCDLCENCMEVTDSKPINDTESKCVKCGLIKTSNNFNEDYCFNDDDESPVNNRASPYRKSKPKRGTHEAEKHCLFWLDKITAIHETEITEEQDKRIHNWFKINNIKNKKLLECEDYRRCFKETQCTPLNDHVTYVRQRYSGISPPRISYDEKREIVTLFILVVEIYEDIKEGENNLKYYPYFIYKILPYVIKDGRRCMEIQKCIHLQSSVTLKSNDIIWKRISNTGRLPIDYRKTDSNPDYT